MDRVRAVWTVKKNIKNAVLQPIEHFFMYQELFGQTGHKARFRNEWLDIPVLK